jgi:hypothetical protein
MMTLLACKIFPGGFSGEFTFQITLDDGTEHIGLAARQYFWDKEGKPVTQPSAKGVDGYVAVRILERRSEEDSLIISVPDGEVLKIKKSRVLSTAQESLPHVPVGS